MCECIGERERHSLVRPNSRERSSGFKHLRERKRDRECVRCCVKGGKTAKELIRVHVCVRDTGNLEACKGKKCVCVCACVSMCLVCVCGRVAVR